VMQNVRIFSRSVVENQRNLESPFSFSSFSSVSTSAQFIRFSNQEKFERTTICVYLLSKHKREKLNQFSVKFASYFATKELID
jgi:hypothetical protein